MTFAAVTFAFTAVESSFSWLVVLRFKDLIHDNAIKAFEANGQQLWSSLTVLKQTALIEKAQTGTVATIFSIVGITILIVQGSVMMGMAKKFGETRLIKIGALILTGTLLGIAFANQLVWMYFFAAMIAVGTGILNPSLSSLITKSAGPQERGTISGAQQGLGSLSRIVAPPINNYLISIYSFVPFLFSSVLMFGAFLMSLKIRQSEAVDGPTEAAPVH